MKQTAVIWLATEFYEKLEVKGDGAVFNNLVEQAKEIEKQEQNEFAIGFLNWVLSPKTSDLIHRLDIAGEIDEDITPEQLLKIFKKEQGL